MNGVLSLLSPTHLRSIDYLARQAPPQQNPVFRRQEEKKNVPAERKPALHACILIYNYR